MSRYNLIKTFGNEDAHTFNKCSKAYEMGRADAIDEFARKLVQWKPQNEEYMSFRDVVFQIAEQLKEQKIEFPNWCGEDVRCDEVRDNGCPYMTEDGDCNLTIKLNKEQNK